MEQNKKIGYKDIFKQKEYMKMMVAALINRFGICNSARRCVGGGKE